MPQYADFVVEFTMFMYPSIYSIGPDQVANFEGWWVPFPPEVCLSGDSICWPLENELRLRSDSASALEAFTELRGRPQPEILRFANKWGEETGFSLWRSFDVHKGKTGHNRQLRDIDFDFATHSKTRSYAANRLISLSLCLRLLISRL